MSHATGWFVGIGITLLIELFLVWRIARTLDRGTIRIDPMFWLADTFGFDFTVSRAISPILYWLGVLSVMAFAVLVFAIFVLIAVRNLR